MVSPYRSYASVVSAGLVARKKEKKTSLSPPVLSAAQESAPSLSRPRVLPIPPPFADSVALIDRLAARREDQGMIKERVVTLIRSQKPYFEIAQELGALAYLVEQRLPIGDFSTLVRKIEGELKELKEQHYRCCHDPKVLPSGRTHHILNFFAQLLVTKEGFHSAALYTVERFLSSTSLAAYLCEEQCAQITAVCAQLRQKKVEEALVQESELHPLGERFVRLECKLPPDGEVTSVEVRRALLLSTFFDLRQEQKGNCYAIAPYIFQIYHNVELLFEKLHHILRTGELIPGSRVGLSYCYPFLVKEELFAVEGERLKEHPVVAHALLFCPHSGRNQKRLVHLFKGILDSTKREYARELVTSYTQSALQCALLSALEFRELNMCGKISSKERGAALLKLMQAVESVIADRALVRALEKKMREELFLIECAGNNLLKGEEVWMWGRLEHSRSFSIKGVKHDSLEELLESALFLYVPRYHEVISALTDIGKLLYIFAVEISGDEERARPLLAKKFQRTLIERAAEEMEGLSEEEIEQLDLILFSPEGGKERSVFRASFAQTLRSRRTHEVSPLCITRLLLNLSQRSCVRPGLVLAGYDQEEDGHIFTFESRRCRAWGAHKSFLISKVFGPARRQLARRIERGIVQHFAEVFAWSQATVEALEKEWEGRTARLFIKDLVGKSAPEERITTERRAHAAFQSSVLAQIDWKVLLLALDVREERVQHRVLKRIEALDLETPLHVFAYKVRKYLLQEGGRAIGVDTIEEQICAQCDLPLSIYLGDANHTAYDSSNERAAHITHYIVYDFGVRALRFALRDRWEESRCEEFDQLECFYLRDSEKL